MGLVIATLRKYFLLTPVILLLTIENGVLQTTATTAVQLHHRTLHLLRHDRHDHRCRAHLPSRDRPRGPMGPDNLQLMILLGSLVASLVTCGTSSMKTRCMAHSSGLAITRTGLPTRYIVLGR
ncbi:uncharacterized protein FPRO_14631 [Fusarium proliferatum ET1]|uniref:Uncharacterized protein n=1 Tax=Fusarium proliferatum (strain ET1) TaxID=1227346 RepID=A0A1L7VWS7_FUSPR|nr:uncharacterized protein FPRO_14631 [Fusarium proliferatum ET1]CZR44879.1 uncharacterized protein FPRO_14631 [Fusarium proliferatum ET1]